MIKMNFNMKSPFVFAIVALSVVSTFTSANPLCGGKAGCQTASVDEAGKSINVGHTSMEGARKSYEAQMNADGSVSGKTGSGNPMSAGKTDSNSQASYNGKSAATNRDSGGVYTSKTEAGKSAQAQVVPKTSFDTRTNGGQVASGQVDPSNPGQYNVVAEGNEKFKGLVNKDGENIYAKNVNNDVDVAKVSGIKKGSKTVSAAGKKDGNAVMQFNDGATVDSGRATVNKETTNIFGKKKITKTVYQADVANGDSISKYQLSQSLANGKLKATNRGQVNKAKNEVAVYSKTGSKPVASLALNGAEELECDHLGVNLNDKMEGGFRWIDEATEVDVEANEKGEYTWPACMMITTKVQIPAGIRLDDVAASLTVLIPNCGEMRCMGKECHGLQCFFNDFCAIKPEQDAWLSKSEVVQACDGQMVTSAPRNETVQFRFCPNVEQSVEDGRQACATATIFDKFRSSLEIQMNLYTYKSDGKRGCDLSGRLNLSQRACKRVRVSYTLKAFGKDYSASINRFDSAKRKLEQLAGTGVYLGSGPLQG